ncbi:helix-turn-helix transcriptional regulator [Nonomuraea sp. NPDC052116]|uniref:helix-turn-helix domain-containing protein n=1 Tax=Nonomuraea sp. NPDC052116 TaxID=3155665 RepID=UPI0034283176
MGEPAGQEPGVTMDKGGPPLGSPAVLRILVGSQLRRLREARGITADEAGYAIRGSQSKISRLESGRISFKQRDVADLLILYGVTDQAEREALLTMARLSNAPDWWQRYSDVIPGWFQPYLGLEEGASAIRNFEAIHVPDLLQTREYANALGIIGQVDIPPSARERRVDFTARRQQLLRQPPAPLLWFLIDEAVLLRQVGDQEIMCAQLEHLIEVSSIPNVTVRILPSAAPRREGGPFSILRFADASLPDVVFIEHLNQALYLDKEADVYLYRKEFERLCLAAHDLTNSQRVIREAIASLSG